MTKSLTGGGSVDTMHPEEVVMQKNMGSADRAIRLLLAVVVAVRYFTGELTGVAAIVLGLFAVVFAATSLVGTCPLYGPLGLSSRGSS